MTLIGPMCNCAWAHGAQSLGGNVRVWLEPLAATAIEKHLHTTSPPEGASSKCPSAGTGKQSFHFYLTPCKQGSSLQVEILSVCPSLITSYCFYSPYSDSRNLPKSTLVTQPFPRYPMSPIHGDKDWGHWIPWETSSHARQSTGPRGPPSQSLIWGRVTFQLDIFKFGLYFVLCL